MKLGIVIFIIIILILKYFYRYFEQFGETVRASREGNSDAITKGLKTFAQRVSSIFKSDGDDRLLLRENSIFTDTMSDDESDGSASGESAIEDVEENNQNNNIIEQEVVNKIEINTNLEKEDESHQQIVETIEKVEEFPLSNLNLPIEATKLESNDNNNVNNDNHKSEPESLLALIEQTTENEIKSTSKPTTSHRVLSSEVIENDFEVMTFQKMKLLSQRIFDSVRQSEDKEKNKESKYKNEFITKNIE